MGKVQFKTFEFQSKLPRLPIPSLKHTAATYFESCLPFFSDQQELAEYKLITDDFFKTKGLAEKLQSRLIEHDKTQKNSWLETWWLEYAYHGWRSSVMINSNWALMVRPHKDTPLITQFKEGFTDFQIYRAAGFTSIMLDYKEKIEKYLLDLFSETLEPEIGKTGPVDMNQYRNIFGITRIPKPGCDANAGTHPSKSRHIILLIKDQIV
jgi:carnitine O-acetyltransferase